MLKLLPFPPRHDLRLRSVFLNLQLNPDGSMGLEASRRDIAKNVKLVAKVCVICVGLAFFVRRRCIGAAEACIRGNRNTAVAPLFLCRLQVPLQLWGYGSQVLLNVEYTVAVHKRKGWLTTCSAS